MTSEAFPQFPLTGYTLSHACAIYEHLSVRPSFGDKSHFDYKDITFPTFRVPLFPSVFPGRVWIAMFAAPAHRERAGLRAGSKVEAE
jgi:hypothetical protein